MSIFVKIFWIFLGIIYLKMSNIIHGVTNRWLKLGMSQICTNHVVKYNRTIHHLSLCYSLLRVYKKSMSSFRPKWLRNTLVPVSDLICTYLVFMLSLIPTRYALSQICIRSIITKHSTCWYCWSLFVLL